MHIDIYTINITINVFILKYFNTVNIIHALLKIYFTFPSTHNTNNFKFFYFVNYIYCECKTNCSSHQKIITKLTIKRKGVSNFEHHP